MSTLQDVIRKKQQKAETAWLQAEAGNQEAPIPETGSEGAALQGPEEADPVVKPLSQSMSKWGMIAPRTVMFLVGRRERGLG